MRALLLIAAIAALLQQAPPAPAPAGPPGTDIYLLTLPRGLASIKEVKPEPVATTAGYDNQPMFSPDGQRILFAANRDGKQIDIFSYGRAWAQTRQLTATPENENSPTFLPDGIGDAGGFSVVRTEADKTQRLWRFDAKGQNPQVVLTEIKPVGYHAWVDAKTLALFVLGPPSTLRIASVETGAAQVAAEGIGRSLHRVPGSRRVSFVHREPSGESWVKEIDVDTKGIDRLVAVVEGNGERDMAWMPDGKTILMTGGTKIFSWSRGDSGWTEIFDAATHRLGALTRLAVSPKGDAIALVVQERKN